MDLSRAVIEQGSNLLSTEIECNTAMAKRDKAQEKLERLRADIDDFRESSHSHIESLATTEARSNELEGDLYREMEKAVELQYHTDIWPQCQSN